MTFPGIFELECYSQNYTWGKKGSHSLVAKLSKQTPIEENLPYAELWMGTHPNCPSRTKDNQELLSDRLKNYPELLGAYVISRWAELPFLFKILSIDQPLSLQAHPDKKKAEELHRSDPRHYPDSNYKPEIALPLNGLTSLYGFRNTQELSRFFSKFPPLGNIFSDDFNKENGFASSFSKIMNMKKSEIDAITSECMEYIAENKYAGDLHTELFCSEYTRYKEDIGLILLFFMQIFTVPMGKAMFVDKNQLHAYLQGELAECMANSDNTVRGGFTTKYQDANSLKDMLTFQSSPNPLIEGKKIDKYSKRYSAALKEFELHEIYIPKNESLSWRNNGVPEIFIVISGAGQLKYKHGGIPVERGVVIFVGAGYSYEINSSINLQIIRATIPTPEK